MEFSRYSRLNTIVGWVVFLIAAFTYLSTIEPTTSLWDCGEFVPSSYKLEVCHPPGAPMFLLINRFFTFFAGGNVKMVPVLVNSSSALCSAFAILFLFWSITALGYKLITRGGAAFSQSGALAVLAAGVVGALAYTWSDTFWFSAVEGEVYAMSSMFTALVFWLALKWERRLDRPDHLKWLILIFFLTGMVIGVHLLGLLVIPIVVLMYYYRKYKTTTRGTILAIVIGFAMLGLVQIGVIQWLPSIAARFDLLFVNSFGLPFWSGAIFFFVLLIAVLSFFIWRTHMRGQVLANTLLLCFGVTVLGYTSYAQVPIRSLANTPIDMYNNEDVFTLVNYVGREQYGDTYLITGPYWFAYDKQDGYTTKEGATQWKKGVDGYVDEGPEIKRVFNRKYTTFFPRMYNPDQGKVEGYKYWGKVDNPDAITFGNNLRFFWDYQIKYMYWRYFAWNFIGRQNDIQGVVGEFNQGNWLSGISFIDQMAGFGPQSNLPEYMERNQARNPLYFLPFILGILGAIYQYRRDRKDFWVVAVFFFMTGLAIELYLNMNAYQPRERDYAFVGSFYVFAIWIGLGVLQLYEWLSKRMDGKVSALAAGGLSLIAVPVLMVSQEWDDHDRSGRYTALDYGVNYLESCAPNSVLFTNGDNDTYPLWYAQEVEGIRTDVRIINLSLFSTDWYVNQMRHPINGDGPALSFTLDSASTLGWDYLIYNSGSGTFNQSARYNLLDVIKFIGSKDPSSRLQMQSGQNVPYLPVRNFIIPIDRDAVIKRGLVPAGMEDKIVKNLEFSINRNSLLKGDVMLLDFLATNAANGWPINVYFSVTSGPNEYLSLGGYMRQEGLTYHLVPYRTGDQSAGANSEIALDGDIMYDNVMNKFRWGNMDGDKILLMDYVMARQANNLRGVMGRLAAQLLAEGKKDKAIAVLDKCQEVLPQRQLPYDFYMLPLVQTYSEAGAKEKANKLSEDLTRVFTQELDYYQPLSAEMKNQVRTDIERTLYGMYIVYQTALNEGNKTLSDLIKAKVTGYQNAFVGYRVPPFDQVLPTLLPADNTSTTEDSNAENP